MTSRDPLAFVFDLDGTLVDSVYQHVLAWREALEEAGIELSVWRIHRRIGMSGGLFVNALLRETGRELTSEESARIHRRHAEAYLRYLSQVRPLPGARELLQYLTDARVPWAVATSGRLESAAATLELLAIPAGAPVVTRDQVEHAKPDPDLFRIVCTTIPRTCSSTWTKSASGPRVSCDVTLRARVAPALRTSAPTARGHSPRPVGGHLSRLPSPCVRCGARRRPLAGRSAHEESASRKAVPPPNHPNSFWAPWAASARLE